MQSPIEPAQPRARRACEPCRRKKTKCPGERPTCSFCRRLNQTCTYSRRQESGYDIDKDRRLKSLERASSRERLQQLESHVEQIYGLLSNISEANPQSATPSSSNITRTNPHPVMPVGDGLETSNFAATSQPSGSWFLDLDEEIVNHAVQVYAERIHCQPLPLFGIVELASRIRRWPQHLLLSFMALTARFSPDILPAHIRQDRLGCHLKARRELMIKLAENDNSLEILQSLCLLILNHIAESNKVAAWVDIGIGGRLAIVACTSSTSRRNDEWARVCWSLHALDRIYCASYSMVYAIPIESGLPNYPQSHPIPQIGSPSAAIEPSQNNRLAQSESVTTVGIDLCCSRLLSVWGHAMTFLRSVKDAESSAVWSENGLYQKIVAQLYNFETTVGQAHRLRNTRFAERSSAELESDRGYWAPWLMMQFLYHAVQVLINHPFLHLAKRREDHTIRPPSFLQHTFDQMLLHSSWVTNCIDLCDEKNFEINDPFIAHLASVTATGYLFSLNADNLDLAQQARRGFDTCYSFIERLTAVWAHLNNTIHKLDILRQNIGTQSSTDKAAPAPSVQASLLWSLFEYSSSTTPTSLLESSPATVELNVTTQFLSPLNSVHNPLTTGVEDPEVAQTTTASISHSGAGQIEPDLSAFDNYLSIFDSTLMAQIHAPNLSGDYWTEFGQL